MLFDNLFLIRFNMLNKCKEIDMNVPMTKVTSKGKELKLVWHDEFNKNGLPDADKWIFEEGFVRNNEYQYYTKAREKNCRVEDGRLIIEALLEDYEYAEGMVAECTSASIQTNKQYLWKYGRFEIRAKVPRGLGSWPAIWMLGVDKKCNVFSGDTANVYRAIVPTRCTEEKRVYWPNTGEIDIMEYVGYDPGHFHFTLHGPKKGCDHNHVQSKTEIYSPQNGEGEEDFATFAIEWDEEGITAFFNDEKYAEYKRGDEPCFEPYPFDNEHFLLINLAYGGGWGGLKGMDLSIFPIRFEIDYVRIYQ